MPWFNDEAAAFKDAELRASDALLLGRKTYEGFAAAWPAIEAETGDFGVKMNTMPKYVVTSTLTTLDWSGSRPVTGDVVAEVDKLRRAPGGDLLLAGSGQLFNALRAANRIDRYRLMVHPVLLGHGPKLFEDGIDQSNLRLVDSQTFASGIVILEYEPETPA